jgi:hypothetical protein
VSEHTHCRWQLDKGSWISNDVKDENRCVWVLESDYLNMKESLEAENARLKAEVDRLTKDYDTIFKDRALLWASHKIALQDIQGLHYALQTAKEGKQS